MLRSDGFVSPATGALLTAKPFQLRPDRGPSAALLKIVSGCGPRRRRGRIPAGRRSRVCVIARRRRREHLLDKGGLRVQPRLLGCGAFSARNRLCMDACRHIDDGDLLPLENAVDLAGVLGPGHDVHDAVFGFLLAQGAVQDAVLLRLLAELFELFRLDREDAKLLPAAEHTGQARPAPRTLLILEKRAQQNGKLPGPGSRDPDRVLAAVQHDLNDLICRFGLDTHVDSPRFLCC